MTAPTSTGATSSAEQDPGPAPPRRRLEALLGVPFTHGNRIDVLRNGDEVFPAMLEAVQSAQRTVDLLWFLWGHGDVTERFTDALAERARAGVRVRVLLDGFGARGIAGAQVRRMREAGCEVAFLRPLRGGRLSSLNLRTHRRALVCDGTVGFTGGTGIDHSWTGDAGGPGDWRDTAFRLQGPAVDGLRSAFAVDWLQTAHPVTTPHDLFPEHGAPGTTAVQVVRTAAQPGWNDAALAVLTLLDLAQERVRITTPYARPPERVHAALEAAVRRGVEVELLVSGPADRRLVGAQSRSHYARLLDAGVQLWTYERTLLHAKALTVDGELALVGTTNLDVRSLGTNEQVNLLLADAGVTGLLDTHFEDDLRGSSRLDGRSWRGRGARERLVEIGSRVFGKPMEGMPGRGQAGPRP